MNLSCVDLIKKYNDKKVVNKVNIDLQAKKIIGLLGPNGAGKTTTFYMLVGLIKCNSGLIKIDDTDITNLPMHIRSDLGISYLPQEPSIFRNLNVRDNIMAILETRKHLTHKQRKIKLDSLVSTLQIEGILKNNGSSLSGGERRRVEIARALAIEPRFLLLDEPFAGIDPISIIEIQKIIKDLINVDIGVLITDHNVRETLKIIDKVYIVNEGGVYFEGSPDEAVKNDNIKKFYLGSDFKI